VDINTTHVHVHDVRFDTSLHNLRGQADALGGQNLHQGLGDHPTTMVAPGRSATLERPGLEDIHMDIEIDGGRHFKQEK
jgi:hypothetical protein